MLKLAKLGIFAIFVMLLVGFAIQFDVVAQSLDDSNSVYLGSVGGVGNKACKNAGYSSCVKIQSRNNNRNEWRDAPEYTCSSNIGASGYRAVCSRDAGAQVTTPSDSGITKSAGITKSVTPESGRVVCTASTGSWSEPDPVTGEGCGRRTRHICPENRDVEDINTCIRIVDFEVTQCTTCDSTCAEVGKDSGVCYSGALPFDTEIRRNFNIGILNLGWGNAGCNTGQSCYCYNSAEVPRRVNVISSGVCTSVSRSVDLPQAAQQTRTNVAIGGTCSNDPECESGFCNEIAGVCTDECYTKSLSQCRSGNKCVLKSGYPEVPESDPNAVCLNKIGDTKIVNELAKLASSGSDPGTKYDTLIAIKKIMEDYNINYGEYVSAWEKENSKLRAGIPSPAFSGYAVRINTATEGCPDFVSTGASSGKVDYDDFFRFIDEFGKTVDRNNEKFDLEKDQYKIIGLGDFFKFADNFGKEVECFTPELIEILDKQGECRDGVCSFKLKAVGKYQGRRELNVNIRGDDYNDKTFLIRITGGAIRKITNLLTGSSVFDITGFAADDAVYQDVTNPSTGKSRFECGLQLNPGFCCPAGYATSSDGSRCVLAESETRYCADFNSDNRVDFIDYFYLADNFGAGAGEQGYDARVDLDNSGDIGFDDFFLFADEFGKEPEC